MSTKAIREALEWMKAECGEPRVREAVSEVEAIERAARALFSAPFDMQSVAEGIITLTSIAKESK